MRCRWRYRGAGALLALWLLAPSLLFAQPRVDQLEARLSDLAGRERLELLIELTARYRKKDRNKAVAFGTEALDLLESFPDRDLELELLNQLGLVHIRAGKYQEALRYGLRAERLARVADDKPALAFALNNVGDAHRLLDEYDPAREYSLEATELYRQVEDEAGLAESLSDVGVAYRRVGDFSKALEYYLRSHRAYEDIGDRKGAARVLNNLGIVYRNLGQPENAIEFYQQALEIREQDGRKISVARLLNNIGVAYEDMGQHAQAIDYYSRALEIKEKLGNERAIARTLNNIGLVYQQLGKFDDAASFFGRSLDIKERLGDEKGTASTLFGIAAVHRGKSEWASALDTSNRSLEIATRINARDSAQRSYLQLSEIYTEMGRYLDALEAFKKYEEVKSSIFDEGNREIIAEMQARFESDRKEKEIEILKQRQELDTMELKRQALMRRALVGCVGLLLVVSLLLYNRYRLKTRAALVIEEKNLELEHYLTELEAKNAEMEKFTYTVSHDLKSPLITIRGFLRLLEKDMLAGDAERVRDDVDRVQAATGKMSRLIDELLKLSRIGRVTNAPEEVAVGELAREAADLVSGQIDERGVEVEIAADLPIVVGDRARLLEVMQNLIENGVKYMGDQEDPRLGISWRRAGEEVVFRVSDNGMGIDRRYHQKVFGLFERLDPSIDGTGVGLALVKRIIEGHGGRVWVESEGAGHGSTFCFTLGKNAGVSDLAEASDLSDSSRSGGITEPEAR